MDATFDFGGAVVVVTGAGGALGSAVGEAFAAAGGTVCAIDVVPREEARVDLDAVDYYAADLTDEAAVEETVAAIVDDHGGIDALCNVAGTWLGGDPIEATDGPFGDWS